jgi:hypothetical protein
MLFPSFGALLSNHLILSHIANTIMAMLNVVAIMWGILLKFCCGSPLSHTKAKTISFSKNYHPPWQKGFCSHYNQI